MNRGYVIKLVLLSCWTVLTVIGCTGQATRIETKPNTTTTIEHHVSSKQEDLEVFCSSPSYDVKLAAQFIKYYGETKGLTFIESATLCKDTPRGPAKIRLSELLTSNKLHLVNTLDIDYLIILNPIDRDVGFFFVPLLWANPGWETRSQTMRALIVAVNEEPDEEPYHSIEVMSEEKAFWGLFTWPFPAHGFVFSPDLITPEFNASINSLGREIADYLLARTESRPVKVATVWTKSLPHICLEGDVDSCWSMYQRDTRDFGWLCEAADRGHPEARSYLAEIFETGKKKLEIVGRVEKDLPRAYLWLRLAEKAGKEDASTKADEIQSLMTADELEEAHELLRDWNTGRCRAHFRSLYSIL
jgi:hypothetical protein